MAGKNRQVAEGKSSRVNRKNAEAAAGEAAAEVGKQGRKFCSNSSGRVVSSLK